MQVPSMPQGELRARLLQGIAIGAVAYERSPHFSSTRMTVITHSVTAGSDGTAKARPAWDHNSRS